MDSLQTMVVVPAKVILAQVSQFVTSVLLVVVILIIGWIISAVIKAAVTRLLKALKVDDLSHKIGLEAVLAKGGSNYLLAELIGDICYWLALLITFVVALNAVGLSIAADLLQKVVLYVPNIITAIFILIVGMFVAMLLKNIVRTATINTGIAQANLFSNSAQVVVMVFTIAIALDQLQIGSRIIDLTITIILASIGLGFAIAVGLGCKDLAGRSIGGFFDKLKK